TFTKFSIVPLNKAPIVDAGANRTNVSSPLALLVRVADDNLPGPFSVTWTAPTAPGAVVFSNENALATTASFSVAGLHVLRLWADDGAARSFDDVNVVYSPFASWQAANFAGGGGNPNAAPDVDPDLDGQNNAFEYAVGTNPN